MKAWVFSDLHLEFAPVALPLKIPTADICIVAGDICTRGPEQSVGWLAEHVCPHMPTIFVCGNHEFYRSSIVEGLARGLSNASSIPNLYFLANHEVEIGDVAFWGATLWTDFVLMGSAELAIDHAERVMNDYREIAYSKKPYARLRAAHTLSLHRRSLHFLNSFLDQNRGRKTVVVSHHAPSRQSVLPQYSSDVTSAAFASDLEALIYEKGPTLWVHGHTHQAFDYTVGVTNIRCNPRGYPNEQTFSSFDFQLVVEI
jgi:3',5'-cyclic AMP phosphodiesterase CpdA